MAAQNAEFILVGRSGQIYVVGAYFDDTANNPVRFDDTKKPVAASPDRWEPPEPCTLYDVVLAAATGQTITQITRSGAAIRGAYLLNALHLASVVTRPRLGHTFAPGANLTAVQVA